MDLTFLYYIITTFLQIYEEVVSYLILMGNIIKSEKCFQPKSYLSTSRYKKQKRN